MEAMLLGEGIWGWIFPFAEEELGFLLIVCNAHVITLRHKALISIMLLHQAIHPPLYTLKAPLKHSQKLATVLLFAR